MKNYNYNDNTYPHTTITPTVLIKEDLRQERATERFKLMLIIHACRYSVAPLPLTYSTKQFRFASFRKLCSPVPSLQPPTPAPLLHSRSLRSHTHIYVRARICGPNNWSALFIGRLSAASFYEYQHFD